MRTQQPIVSFRKVWLLKHEATFPPNLRLTFSNKGASGQDAPHEHVFLKSVNNIYLLSSIKYQIFAIKHPPAVSQQSKLSWTVWARSLQVSQALNHLRVSVCVNGLRVQ